MDCTQFLPGQATPLCQVIALFVNGVAWAEAHAAWVIGAIGTLTLLLVIWNGRSGAAREAPSVVQSAKERAELLLRDSISPQAYQSLQEIGYLEIPSRLYANRYYRIPRERRRVQVYEVCETKTGPQHQKLGELCVIACEPMPDADLVLTHKWLIEADEQKYLNTANWVR